MQKITTVADLKSAIEQLKYKQASEWSLLKEQFHHTYESLKPLNILKSTFREATSSPDFKGDLLGTTMGLTAGYLSKALIVGVSHNPIKKLLGTLLQLGISTVVSKNSESIKLLADSIVNFFKKKKETKVEIFNDHSI